MSVESDVRTAMLGMSAVTALVGGSTSALARIRADNFYPTDTLPAILIEVDESNHENDLSGKCGQVFSKVVLTCRASTRDAARSLAEAVRLNGTNPGTGLAGYSGTAFDSWLESEVAARTPKDDGSAGWWYDVVQDYTVLATETT